MWQSKGNWQFSHGLYGTHCGIMNLFRAKNEHTARYRVGIWRLPEIKRIPFGDIVELIKIDFVPLIRIPCAYRNKLVIGVAASFYSDGCRAFQGRII